MNFEAGVRALRCEHLCDPLGIDITSPRLSWRMTPNGRGTRQTAYQVLVASSPTALAEDRGDLWDSGKVDSDQLHLIPYAGEELSSHQQCFWKVRAWDADERPLPWSAPALWSMGILSPDEWLASWIAPSAKDAATSLPIFRREFEVTRPLPTSQRVGRQSTTPSVWNSWVNRMERSYSAWDQDVIISCPRSPDS